MAGIGPIDLQLAFKLVDAREHGAFLRKYCGVVDQELGLEIVAALDHEVESADEI